MNNICISHIQIHNWIALHIGGELIHSHRVMSFLAITFLPLKTSLLHITLVSRAFSWSNRTCVWDFLFWAFYNTPVTLFPWKKVFWWTKENWDLLLDLDNLHIQLLCISKYIPELVSWCPFLPNVFLFVLHFVGFFVVSWTFPSILCLFAFIYFLKYPLNVLLA